MDFVLFNDQIKSGQESVKEALNNDVGMISNALIRKYGFAMNNQDLAVALIDALNVKKVG